MKKLYMSGKGGYTPGLRCNEMPDLKEYEFTQVKRLNMKQFLLAAEYLRLRVIPFKNISPEFLKVACHEGIIPAHEVDAVCKMVEAGEFEHFYNQWKRDRYGIPMPETPTDL